MSTRRQRAPRPAPGDAARIIAVVDVGATAIRMELAEVRADRPMRTLDTLVRPVPLGKDTFTTGVIQRRTTETCVRILRQFVQVLAQYGLTDLRQVKAVATSAVREARNRDRFLNRIYMATGVPLECIDDVELSRLTYLAVREVLSRADVPQPWDVLVLEVGGGSTELLLLQGGRVTASETFRLGSLRLRETLETYRAPAERMRRMLEQSIHRAITQMRRSVPTESMATLVAMSGDLRFAAGQLVPRWDESEIGRLSPDELEGFTEGVMALGVDELVHRYRLTYPEAETVGPALLAYCEIARSFGVREILVPKSHLRRALELELAAQSPWTADLCEQVEFAAAALGRKFQTDPRHAGHVAWICGLLFDALQPDHRLAPRFGFLLRIAALLHEIGLFISNKSHHKHSLYLVLNSDLFGLSQRDIVLVALVSRYHRRSPPLPTHPHYSGLDREQRITVQKLAAILRVACALDRNHTQRLRDLRIERRPDQLAIAVGGLDDVSLERLALREKGQMFEDVYGIPVALSTGPAAKGPESNV